MHGEIAFSHGQSFLTFAKFSEGHSNFAHKHPVVDKDSPDKVTLKLTLEVVQRSVPQQKNPSALISPSYDTKKFQTSPKKCYPS